MIPTVTYVFSLLMPALFLACAWQFLWNRLLGPPNKTGALLAGLVVSAGTVGIPVQGIPLGRWFFGVAGNFSVAFTALVAIGLGQSLAGRQWFTPGDFRTTWLFGGLAGLALYPLALGLGDFDPYALGWQSLAFQALVPVVSLALFYHGSRLGWLLLGAGVGWMLGVLESTNLWDYLVDPCYALIGLTAIGQVLREKVRRHQAS